MNVIRYVAPSLCILFGLYGFIWSAIAWSYPSSLRVTGAFVGILFLLLAFAYVRIILPGERKEIALPGKMK